MTPKTELIVLGDILKAESDRLSRAVITAPQGTKKGQLVDYEPRGEKLVALSDEYGGQVVVQPRNCTIDLNFVELGDTEAKTLIEQGEPHGITYIKKKVSEVPTGESVSGEGVMVSDDEVPKTYEPPSITESLE